MNVNIKNRVSILLIIDLIILIGFVFAAIFLFNSIKKENNQFLVISKSLKLLELKREQFKISKFKNIDINLINNLFLDKNEALKFFNFIEKISSDSQNYSNISIISSGEKIEDGLRIQISLYGSFSNFMKFLNYLENAPYLLQIEDLKIRRLSQLEILQMKQPGFKEGDINSNLLVKVYTQ